jgi:hypothetical protein
MGGNSHRSTPKGPLSCNTVHVSCKHLPTAARLAPLVRPERSQPNNARRGSCGVP